MNNQNNCRDEQILNENHPKVTESKFYKTLFLGTIAGFGLLAGFSSGISLAKKNDEQAFAKGLMMIPEKINGKHAVQLESGTKIAMRALGWGSLYAFSGVALISATIWFGVGAKNLSEFRQKMGELLPKIPKNDPPQSRTEFESLRDLLTYLTEESEKNKIDKLDSNKDVK